MEKIQLSPNQLKVLKRTTHQISFDEYGKSDKEIILEFCQQGLIEKQDPFIYITEKGKAVLSQYRYRLLTDWCPIFISVVALVISIIALLK